jgi:hypothetical protein
MVDVDLAQWLANIMFSVMVATAILRILLRAQR